MTGLTKGYLEGGPSNGFTVKFWSGYMIPRFFITWLEGQDKYIQACHSEKEARHLGPGQSLYELVDPKYTDEPKWMFVRTESDPEVDIRRRLLAKHKLANSEISNQIWCICDKKVRTLIEITEHIIDEYNKMKDDEIRV